MRAISHGRTVFIIAHRLSAVRHADRILVMDEGRLVEQGDHQVLVRQQGIYARLYAMQAGFTREAVASDTPSHRQSDNPSGSPLGDGV